MIEIWRQCVTCVGHAAAGDAYGFVVVGPLRGRGELREVWIWPLCEMARMTHIGMVISGVGEGSLAAMRAGSSLIARSFELAVAGQPTFPVRATSYGYGQFRVVCAMRIVTGASYVIVGWTGDAEYSIGVAATATVIGLARIGANGLGVEDGIDR